MGDGQLFPAYQQIVGVTSCPAGDEPILISRHMMPSIRYQTIGPPKDVLLCLGLSTRVLTPVHTMYIISKLLKSL